MPKCADGAKPSEFLTMADGKTSERPVEKSPFQHVYRHQGGERKKALVKEAKKLVSGSQRKDSYIKSI